MSFDIELFHMDIMIQQTLANKPWPNHTTLVGSVRDHVLKQLELDESESERIWKKICTRLDDWPDYRNETFYNEVNTCSCGCHLVLPRAQS